MIPQRRALAGRRVAQAQELQHELMGYLPGFATPRIVCDVPFVGKRWVHQLESYDDRARHLVLDEELPHLHRGRRRRGARPAVRVLRPDRHAARRGPAVVGRARLESVEAGPCAEAAAAAAASRGAAQAQHAAHSCPDDRAREWRRDRDSRARSPHADGWRSWLASNHATSDGVRLVWQAGCQRATALTYATRCPGPRYWLDSTVSRPSRRRHLRVASRRGGRAARGHSATSRSRTLIADGRMQPAGLRRGPASLRTVGGRGRTAGPRPRGPRLLGSRPR